MNARERIQRQRIRDWKMSEGAIYVGRPSTWGNPYAPATDTDRSLALFRAYCQRKLQVDPHWLEPLRGHDLCCWCPLDQPCHADVLLELANRPRGDAP